MRISAKVDYAVRACLVLAESSPSREGRLTKGDALGSAQAIPTSFLENILSELRRAGIVGSQRGAEGGYWLARPAERVSIADIIRAVEGPLADVRGAAPEDLDYRGAASQLERVWVATRASVRLVLEQTTLQNVLEGKFPEFVETLLDDSDVWSRR